MKGFGKLTLVLILALALATAVLLTLAVEENPLITARAELTPEQIGRAKMIFKNNDPRRLRSGSIAKVSLEQQELDLAINYFANQYLNGAARLQLDRGRALIQSSLHLPTNPLGRFLNVQLEFAQASPLPHVDRLTLGKLRLPGLLADPLVNLAVASLQSQADRTTLANIVKHVQIQPGQLTVIYRWQADLPAKLRNALFDAPDQTRIQAYQRRLVSLSQPLTNGASLTSLSRPLFQLAAERSQSNDPIAENRALILVLSFYANRLPLYKIVPQATSWPRPLWRTATLNGRDDLTKHYLVSAMLAAYSGTPLADAVGLYKEIEDSRGGSGFSFNDLAADRAGTRMGEQAVANQTQARKIQILMAKADEAQMMPATADLPEFMSEAEFISRFGGTEGPAYQLMMQDIEKRIAQLPVNRD